MIVKTVRRGFYNKLREVGETFSYPFDECPTWAVEVANGKAKTDSREMTATDAVRYIKTINDLEELITFAGDDSRKTVQAEYENRTRILEN